MPIASPCPACGHPDEYPDRAAGQKRACRECGEVVVIPAATNGAGVADHLERTNPPPAKRLKAKCPTCGSVIAFAAPDAGKVKRCPACGDALCLRDPSQTPPPPPPPPAPKKGPSIWTRRIEVKLHPRVAYLLHMLLAFFCLNAGIAWLAAAGPNPLSVTVCLLLAAWCVWSAWIRWWRASAAVLQNRVRDMGDPTGRPTRDVKRALGRPKLMKREGGVEEITWKAGGYAITLAFGGDACRGVVREVGVRL